MSVATWKLGGVGKIEQEGREDNLSEQALELSNVTISISKNERRKETGSSRQGVKD